MRSTSSNSAGGIGADYVIECAGTEATINQAIHMANRGGKVCLAAFPHDPVTTDLAYLVTVSYTHLTLPTIYSV